MPTLTNSRHERFAQEVAKGQSATGAYKTAGYDAVGASANVNAARLLRNALVRARVDEILAEGAERAGVTVEKVVRELAKIGFSDIRKVVHWTGSEVADEQDGDDGEGGLPRIVVHAANIVRLISSDDIDDDTAAAVAEVSQTKEGALKVKLHDKRAALVDLGRHLGMFKDKVEHSGPGGGPIQTEQTSARDILASKLARLTGASGPTGGSSKPE